MWHWSVLYCTHQYRNDKCLLQNCQQNAKFQNKQDLNSRTFQGFSSTFKHLICFQALSRAWKYLFQIQAYWRISQARYECCHSCYAAVPSRGSNPQPLDYKCDAKPLNHYYVLLKLPNYSHYTGRPALAGTPVKNGWFCRSKVSLPTCPS